MADEEDGLSELRQRLLSHSACFNSLLELIPAKYYFAENEEEKSNKFYKNKKNKAPKQAVKEASKKAKLSRLDPSQHKTVPEIQAELSNEDGKTAKYGRVVSVENVACSSIGDLRTKLHERIELLRRKRKAPSTLNAESDRPTKKAKNLAKKKESEKQKKNTANSSHINSKHIVNNKKAIVNSEGKVVFSKFDFTSDVAKSQRRGHAKKKNYQKLLEKAESRQRKLEEMKEDKSEKSKEIIETAKWKKALGKSEGVKQKDDPALLKKAIKHKEKQKKKHQKDWKERMENQKKQMKERQDRRQKNIQDRIDKKKKKKGGRTAGF